MAPPTGTASEVVHFPTAAALRAWLEANHASCTELWIGFYKKGSGQVGVTYQEALDEALCFGWIDGVKRRVDDASFTHRFSPRKAKSAWSAVNLKRIAELLREGRVRPPGLAAYERREALAPAPRPRTTELPGAYAAKLAASPEAQRFFAAQPPGYRRNACDWVMSAKKEETRWKRLATLIDSAERGVRIGALVGAIGEIKPK